MRHGNQERVFRLEFVSNQEFTDIEYSKWIEASTAAGNALPAKEHVEQKQADIKEAINYEFNEQDIERIVIVPKYVFETNHIIIFFRFEKRKGLSLILIITQCEKPS